MRPRLQKLQRPPQTEPLPVGDPPPSEDQLRQMISEAAYYRAEKRGFGPGLEAEDWREAESEVLARLRTAQTRL
jgi:hypothetical protein